MDALVTKLLDDYGSIGIVLVCSAFVIMWIANQWMKVQDKLDEEKEKRLQDHQTFFTAQANSNREILTGVQTAIQALMDAYKDRGRS